MNILILDREAALGDRWHKKSLKPYVEYFEERDHSVERIGQLEELAEKELSLKNFDICLAHPFVRDSPSLIQEVQKRHDFKVIFHTIDPDAYGAKHNKHSEQVYVLVGTSPEKTLELVDSFQ